MQRHIVELILWLMPSALRIAARRFPSVREHLAAGNWVIQLRLQDNSLARQLHFKDGTVSGTLGSGAKPDAELVFMDAATARKMLAPTTDHAFLIDALKNFKITQGGSDEALVWFGQLVNTMKTASWRKGTPDEGWNHPLSSHSPMADRSLSSSRTARSSAQRPLISQRTTDPAGPSPHEVAGFRLHGAQPSARTRSHSNRSSIPTSGFSIR